MLQPIRYLFSYIPGYLEYRGSSQVELVMLKLE